MVQTPLPTPAVVVGIDGSASSDLALDWAATEAAAEGLPLVLLSAAAPPAQQAAMWLSAHGIDQTLLRVRVKEEARALLRRCEARVHEAHPDLEVHHDIRVADPRDALLESEAALLVVGTRGLGGVRRLLLGSVAAAVVKQATRPTVVVRPRPEPGTGGGVVVGVAGDEGDAAAVDLGFRVASARGLTLTAYHGLWDVVGVDDQRDIGADEPGYDAERALVSRALAAATARHPEVEVAVQLSRGFADERLIRASRDAELLVVGHRRKPLLNEIVYGSVAPHVVAHARCSVAVVPYQGPESSES